MDIQRRPAQRIHEHFYIPQSQKKRTDITCCFIGAAYALFMFISACVMWNRRNFYTHFSFRNGIDIQQTCNTTQGFIHFPNLRQLKYECVANCPANYISYKNICIPTSEGQERQQFFNNSEIALGLFGEEFIWVIIFTVVISLSLGLIRLCYVNLAPRLSVKFDFYMCVLTLFALAVLLWTLYDVFWGRVTLLKVILIIASLLLVLYIFTLFCMYSNQLKVYQIFIDYAVNILGTAKKIYLYIPFFLVLSLGFMSLILWQHFSFVSRSGKSRVFYNLNSSGIWGILNIIELIWGIRFLRDAFNFCVGGTIVDWYWGGHNFNNKNCLGALSRLLCLHFGSVVGGSFYNAFFEIFTIIFQIFRCYPNTCCKSGGNFCSRNCSCMSKWLDLIRSDPYAYINITGQSYCNSAIQCRRISELSDMYVGIHSPLNHYRYLVHLLCVSLLCVLSWIFMRSQMTYYGIWNYIFLIIIILLTITWFIAIFSDAAEALQICYLCEHQFQTDYQRLTVDQPYRSDIQHRELRVRKDGNR